jgi:cytochrome c oxidase subunit 4
MAHTKLYTIIYVILFVFATAQVGVEFMDLPYWTGFAAILVLSMVKAVLVAGYYQHLRWEPRSLTYLYIVGLTTALFLTVAASYSIQ